MDASTDRPELLGAAAPVDAYSHTRHSLLVDNLS